jgi:hypothetical protein
MARLRGVVRHDLDALRAVYREVDRALDGWTCERSTDCCHFSAREPYLWPNEWALVERALAARGGVPRPRSLPVVDAHRCPLLLDGNTCAIYDSRPYGCRTYFCDRASGPTRRPPRDALVALGRQVADLAQRAEPSHDGPLPLTTWLAKRRG